MSRVVSSATVARSSVAVRLPAASLAVAVAHGMVDAYAAFLHPLLPRIMGKMGLSIALAASLVTTFSIASSLIQPVFGWLAERYGRRLFVVGGPLLSGIFLSLIGVAPTFAVLLAFLTLGGLGSAAFHPPAASMAARVSEGRGSGLRMSVFSFGGAAGFAMGPVIVVALVARTGLEGMWIAMFPALIAVPLLWSVLPSPGREMAAPPPPLGSVLAHLFGPLGVVFGISAIAAFTQRVFLTMEPIIVARAGGSEATGALALSVYFAAQAVGTVAGGILTDRVDRRRLLLGITAASFPAHLLAVALVPGSTPALMAAAAAGFLNMALLPPVIVMAQEILPGAAAVSAGVVMGLAWALGSVGLLVTGVLGDLIGPQAAAMVSMPALLPAMLLALHPALRPYARAR